MRASPLVPVTQRRGRHVERRLGVAGALVEQGLQLQDQQEAEEHDEPAPLRAHRAQDEHGDRRADADVGHDRTSSTGQQAVEQRRDDVAAVERQHRDEVERSDHGTGPEHGGRGRGAAAVGGIERVDAHRGEDSDPGQDVHDGPGEGDGRLGPPRQGLRGVVGRVAGQEVEGDLRLCPCPASGDGVTELMQQREGGDRDRQPDAELVAVDGDDQHHEEQEARTHVDREPEHAHRPRSYELIHPSVSEGASLHETLRWRQTLGWRFGDSERCNGRAPRLRARGRLIPPFDRCPRHPFVAPSEACAASATSTTSTTSTAALRWR